MNEIIDLLRKDFVKLNFNMDLIMDLLKKNLFD